jgi:hypothetical protein
MRSKRNSDFPIAILQSLGNHHLLQATEKLAGKRLVRGEQIVIFGD